MIPRGSPAYRCLRVAVWLLAAVLPVAALEVPLTYKTQDDLRGFFPHGSQHANVTLSVPPGQWKLPELVAPKPAYALLELGDRKHLVVFDFAKKLDRFYSKLYFDANANGDLTDDPVIDGAMDGEGRNPGMYQTHFGAVNATITVDGKELPYRFSPQIYCFLMDQDKDVTEGSNWQNINFYVRPMCAFQGSLSLDGKAYTIWLGDQNGNGHFKDQFGIMGINRPGDAIYPTGDTFYLIGQGERLSYECGQTLGKYLVLEDKVFEVAVEIAKGRMILTPVTENLATLRTPMDLASLEVYSEGDKKAVMLFTPGKQAPVPADRYRLLAYRLLMSDSQGDRWQLTAMGATGSPDATAHAGESATLELGEPFAPVVEVDEYSRQQLGQGSRQVALSLTIRGAGHEVVGQLQRISGNSTKIGMSTKQRDRPAEPRYKIVSSDGEVVTSGQFEYG